MALQQNINIPIGYNLSFKYTDFNFCTKNSVEILENAYIKILNYTGDKNNTNLEIGIFDKKDGNLIKHDVFTFTPDISDMAKNIVKQGYEQLKANKFIDALDLLENDQTP